MKFFNKREEAEYIPPLELLDNMCISPSDTEVIFTLGEQEIIKENDKYFLANVINSNISKEITKDAAYELIQIKNQQKSIETPKIYED